MRKFLFIFGVILISTKAIALQNFAVVDPVAYFQKISEQVQTYKYQIQRCYEMTKAFTYCNGGMNGIDSDITQPTGNIASLKTINGVMTIYPVPVDLIQANDSYVLTPSVYYTHTFSWTASGASVEKQYVDF